MPVTHTHTTSEHVLAKFSSKSRRSDGSQADWMHWASPTLLITLAVAAASDGAVHAANLSIIWRRDGGATGRGDITLEELDLLSFSQISASPLQTRPLRAVYNGAVVGIRYMHPLTVPPSSQPTFNQIQVRFQDASDASQFVAALARFCPCKEEPSRPNTNAMGPPPAKQIILTRTPSTASRPTFRHGTPAFSPMHMSSSPAPAASSSSRRPGSIPQTPRQAQTTAYTYEESQVELSFDSASQLPDVTPAPRPQVPLQRAVSLAMPAPATATATPAELKRAISMLDSAAAGFSTTSGRTVSSTPAPPPALTVAPTPPAHTPPTLLSRTVSDDAMQLDNNFTSAVDPALAHIPPTPERGPSTAGPSTVASPHESVLSSLREVPELYQLTTPQLERAVAEIVREPGFMEFVRLRPFAVTDSRLNPKLNTRSQVSRVEAMWHVRGLVGR